jgi:membrane protein required for colicin V production
MPTFNDLTYFDIIILAIFLAFSLRGLWIGSIRQLTVLLALVGGYYLAGQYAHAILPLTERFVANPQLTFMVSYVLIFLGAVLVFSLMGRLLHGFMRVTLLGWLDHLVGLAIGGIKAAVVASLLYMLLASTLSTTNDLLRKSRTSPYLRQGANILRSWIDDPRLRNAFAQKEPAILSELLSGHQQTQRQEPRKTAP